MKQIFTMDVERDIDVAVRFAEILREKGKVGEFYICGYLVEKYPEKVKKIAKDHILGGHGYYHERFETLDLKEQESIISKTINIFKKNNLLIQGWRFPYLSFTKQSLAIIKKYKLFDSSINQRRIFGRFYFKKGFYILPHDLIEKPWDYSDSQHKNICSRKGRLIVHCYNQL
ncbi:MAG: polysaccharide deacetylase family protein [Candidatus Woesearchaeota archaeon]